MSNINSWMSWEGGVDLVAVTQDGLAMPNVIIHVARMVHTPVGSAPAGMVFWQPDPAATPAVMGFISPDAAVGAYFGPNIFAGTPFATAPHLPAIIGVNIDYVAQRRVSARIETAGHIFEVEFPELGDLEHEQRPPVTGFSPFNQDVVVAKLKSGPRLKVDGSPVNLTGAVGSEYAATGLYSR